MNRKRILTMLLALLMALTYMPAVAFADVSEWVDTSDYTEKVTYPNATVKYTAFDGRTLTAHYAACSSSDDPDYNFPEPGDTIKMTHKGGSDVYTCNDELKFISESGEELLFNPYMDPEEAGAIKASALSDPVINQAKKRVTYKYATDFRVDAKVTSDAMSIRFEPEKITVDSEDVKVHAEYVVYDIERRGGLLNGYDDIYTAFVPGDKLIVTYADGERTYSFDKEEGLFLCDNGDPEDRLNPSVWNSYLKEGYTGVEIRALGRSTWIEVYMLTPRLKAAREWKGTLSKDIPAAKKVKVKAGKKKVTVRWTKANAANLEKFDKVEVQVCPNKKFARSKTVRTVVSKSKKSCTVKKRLKSGKYYWVRVRNVKGKGLNKLVSKWSKAKRVKVK